MQIKQKQSNRLKQYDSYVVGYYGMQNSGDDALMYSTLWGAKHMLNHKRISLGLYGVPDKGLLVSHQFPLHQQQAFPGYNRLTHYRAALQSSNVIFGGGSVLHSESDINLKRHMLKLAYNRNSRAVGVSLGPFANVAAEKACAQFLNECPFVGLRDKESLAIAQAIAPQANANLTFDLAPTLLYSTQVPEPKARRGIALALCPVAVNAFGEVNIHAERERITQIARLIETLYHQTGEPITLLTFNGHCQLGDGQINHAIFNKLCGKLPLVVKPYDNNPLAVLKDLGQYQAIISMRLHGSILGYLAQTPVISINYHSKCTGWCEQIGLADKYQYSADEFSISAISQRINDGLKQGFTAPQLTVEDALSQTLLNWSTDYE